MAIAYHASPHEFAVGDLVEPGHPPAYGGRPHDHVFFTLDRRNAMTWARTGPRPAAVYEVAMPGEYEPDPRPCGREEYQTRESLRVIGVIRQYRPPDVQVPTGADQAWLLAHDTN
jgi:hypothetical protein